MMFVPGVTGQSVTVNAVVVAQTTSPKLAIAVPFRKPACTCTTPSIAAAFGVVAVSKPPVRIAGPANVPAAVPELLAPMKSEPPACEVELMTQPVLLPPQTSMLLAAAVLVSAPAMYTSPAKSISYSSVAPPPPEVKCSNIGLLDDVLVMAILK